MAKQFASPLKKFSTRSAACRTRAIWVSEKAGVILDLDRFMTNSQMQSNVPHIFGAGDCTGMYEIVHIAIQQGEIAAYNILHPDHHRAIDYRLLISMFLPSHKWPASALPNAKPSRRKSHTSPPRILSVTMANR